MIMQGKIVKGKAVVVEALDVLDTTLLDDVVLG